MGGQRSELVGRAAERPAGLLGDLARGQVAEARIGVEPRPDGRPAEGQLVEAGSTACSPPRAPSSWAAQPPMTWPSVTGVAS